jgi:multicomponent Na+:H+ antiporter subunit E
MTSVVVGRATGFLAFWLILTGPSLADILAGILAAIIATWASVRLLPPGERRLDPLVLIRLVLRFPRQSIGAGIDTARRALDPRLPLRPGFVVYRTRLPPGPAQNAFCTVTSLLPGTLPCGAGESGGLIIHCLDACQSVAAQLTLEEALFLQALGGPSNG